MVVNLGQMASSMAEAGNLCTDHYGLRTQIACLPPNSAQRPTGLFSCTRQKDGSTPHSLCHGGHGRGQTVNSTGAMLLGPGCLRCQWDGLSGVLSGRGKLTGIVLLLRVFDVGGELREDVDAGRVGLPVFRSQFRVPRMEGVVF